MRPVFNDSAIGSTDIDRTVIEKVRQSKKLRYRRDSYPRVWYSTVRISVVRKSKTLAIFIRTIKKFGDRRGWFSKIVVSTVVLFGIIFGKRPIQFSIVLGNLLVQRSIKL